MTEQRATSDGRSAMWAIIGVLVGAFLPIFLCVCLIATTVVGLGASLGSAAPSPEIVAGAGPIRARYLSGPLTGPAVAVISVNGPIVSGEVSDFNLVGTTVVAASAEIARLIKAAAENSDVKAILLKVDSPGGSVIGSDEITRRSRKPASQSWCRWVPSQPLVDITSAWPPITSSLTPIRSPAASA